MSRFSQTCIASSGSPSEFALKFPTRRLATLPGGCRNMELTRLPHRPGDWDSRIAGFDKKTLFHESAWLDFLVSTNPRARVDYYAIQRQHRVIGYFCAARLKKAIVHSYESPLGGRGIFMGPLIDHSVAVDGLVTALVALCRRERIALLEICSDGLEPAAMEQLGFSHSLSQSHICPLTGGLDRIWQDMRGTCRTRIRKAQKSGLSAEVTEALYPHDERVMYFWDGASDPDCLHHSPNELLHWTAIEQAVSRGVAVFNMGGGSRPSRFTTKFGGETSAAAVYRKSFVPFFERAQEAYRRLRSAATGRPSRERQPITGFDALGVLSPLLTQLVQVPGILAEAGTMLA